MTLLASGLMGMRGLASLGLIYLLVFSVLAATIVWTIVVYMKLKNARHRWSWTLLSIIPAFAVFVVVAVAVFVIIGPIL